MNFESTIQIVNCPECDRLTGITVPDDQIMVVISPIPHLDMSAEAGPLNREHRQDATCPEGHTFYVYTLRSGIITL